MATATTTSEKKDVRLYFNTYEYKRSYLYEPLGPEWEKSEYMASAPLDKKTAGHLETIANKVVKYLLTSRGTDVLDPNYGSLAASKTYMHAGQQARYTYELNQDLTNCLHFIKRNETPGPNGERLASIQLVKLEYLPFDRPTEVHIYLRIFNTANQAALVSINRNLQD